MPKQSRPFMLLPCAALAAFFIGSVYASPLHADDAAVTNVTSDGHGDTTRDSTGRGGDLLVAPTRIVIEDRTHSAQITLSNTGPKEQTYRVSFTHLHMDDNGKYEEVNANKLPSLGEKSADDLLRFSPRQVTLKPGEAQVIKVVVHKPDNLADGEYRSHLSFSGVPDAATGEDVEAKAMKPGEIGIRLIPVYGVSIPIILRQGNLSAKAGISNVKLDGKSLSLTLTRSGNESLYGDVVATYTPDSGEPKVVGEMRGVAVFVPNQKRSMTLALDGPVNGGSLTVEYLAREGDKESLAKTSLKL